MNISLEKSIDESIKDLSKLQPGNREEAVKKKFGLEKVLTLSTNENPVGCPSPVESFLVEADFNVENYPDSSQYKLSNALADFYDISSEKIIAGNGSAEIIDLSVELMTNPGDDVILSYPTFPKYKLACKARQIEPIEVPLTENYRHDLESMYEEVTEQTKIIFLCDPNNPTGTIINADKLEKFLKKIPEHVLVIVDQAYNEYVKTEKYFDGIEKLDSYPNLFIIRTFSKIYGMAGLRVGYGLGNKTLIEFFQRIRSPFNVNLIAQKAAVKALNCQNHIWHCSNMNHSQRNLFADKFTEMGIEFVNSQANFMLLKTKVSNGKVFKQFASNGLLIRTGITFKNNHWIRFTIPSEKNSKFVLEVFQDMKKKEIL